jgi:hypothetical protein
MLSTTITGLPREYKSPTTIRIGSIQAIEGFIDAVNVLSRLTWKYIEAINGSSRTTLRFTSRFGEKNVCQTPSYQGSLEAVEALIQAPIKGIEGKQKKVSQAQPPSLNKLDKVIALADRECIFCRWYAAPRMRSKAHVIVNTVLMPHTSLGKLADDKPPLPDFPEDPKTVKEAMKHLDANKWKNAMKAEWDALLENQAFNINDTVSPPTDKWPISSKWVFKIKINSNGMKKYKARLLCRGFTQVEGVDYDEVYAPASKLATLRYLISLSAQRNYDIRHLDIVTAFLNPMIDRDDIWITLPAGIANVDKRSKEYHYAFEKLFTA